jgi:glycosyltransferase involved in cell wall biosynthesis
VSLKLKVTMIVRNSVWYDPRVRRAAETAMEAGIDITVIGLKEERYEKNRIDELSFKTIIVDADLSLQRGDISIYKKIKREIISNFKLIKACIKTNPNVIHAHDLDALPIAYLASKKTNAGIIFDSHEIFCENNRIRESKIKYTFWKMVEHFLIKRVNSVVSVSNAAAKKLSEIYQIKEPVVVTNAAKKIPNSKLMLKATEKFEVLTHGKFYKGRGYETFVRTASLLSEYRDIKMILRGLGPLEKDLHKIAYESNVGGNLSFDPPVLVNEMVPYAARSHVGVAITEPININFTYTVSNKLFEYITAGLPVIMSDVPEHRYLNEKYNFGIIMDENTPECLAKSILKLYENKSLYYTLAENAKQTAKVLNWESEFEKMLNLYKEAKK